MTVHEFRVTIETEQDPESCVLAIGEGVEEYVGVAEVVWVKSTEENGRVRFPSGSPPNPANLDY